ncbi:MAG: hypothetical protein R2844_17750 [Caldilineales bacterium]
MLLPAADIQTKERPPGTPAACASGREDSDPELALHDRCPVCGRGDALLVLDEVVYCAACGYASDGARGCT